LIASDENNNNNNNPCRLKYINILQQDDKFINIITVYPYIWTRRIKYKRFLYPREMSSLIEYHISYLLIFIFLKNIHKKNDRKIPCKNIFLLFLMNHEFYSGFKHLYGYLLSEYYLLLNKK
jgi:hypothetical protein